MRAYSNDPWSGPVDTRITCRLSCLGKWEIIQQACTTMLVCIIILVFAVRILSPLNDIEEYADEHGGRLDVNPNVHNLDGSSGQDFDAGSSRGAAGFLIFVCCAGIVFHSVSIIVRVYFICVGTRKHMDIYFALIILLVLLFGICFFAGGITNLIFFVAVNSLSGDCTPGHVPRELCDDLESVARNQLISFALSISNSVLFAFLWLPMCLDAYKKFQDDRDDPVTSRRVQTTTTTGAARHTQANFPSNTSMGVPPSVQANIPSNTSTNGVPYISKYVSPSVSKDPPPHTSTDPPTYASTEPPSYEAAIADTVV